MFKKSSINLMLVVLFVLSIFLFNNFGLVPDALISLLGVEVLLIVHFNIYKSKKMSEVYSLAISIIVLFLLLTTLLFVILLSNNIMGIDFYRIALYGVYVICLFIYIYINFMFTDFNKTLENEAIGNKFIDSSLDYADEILHCIKASSLNINLDLASKMKEDIEFSDPVSNEEFKGIENRISKSLQEILIIVKTKRDNRYPMANELISNVIHDITLRNKKIIRKK